jgi:hypothetical protein
MTVEHESMIEITSQDTKIMRSWVKTTHQVHGNMEEKGVNNAYYS